MKLFLCLLIWPLSIHHQTRISDRLIIWNVGQGLWVTSIAKKRCLHFDSGGDRMPQTGLLKHCENKINQHHLSHLDWDHIGYIWKLKKSFHLCRAGSPYDKKRVQKQKKYESIPECRGTLSSVREIPIELNFKKPNDNSRIFTLKNWALLPGDSTKKAEKAWAHMISKSMRVLVLGHHGSNTSTHKYLLSTLPQLSLAIASARKKKYGHPHPKVLKRLEKYGVPVLRTEDWGNIILEEPYGR